MEIPEAAIEAAARELTRQALQAALPALREQWCKEAGDGILQALDMEAELDEPTGERVGGIVLDALKDFDAQD